MKTKTSFKKGHAPTYTAKGREHSRYKHGMASTNARNPLYQKWAGIKRRCYNKKDKSYARYGGAGVVVSDEWLSFENFHKDMAESYFKGASIDRIDNSKGYSKENCRWVELSEQGKNKTTVPLYTLNGITLNSSDWDRKLGLKEGTVRARIKMYRWPIEKALTKSKTTHKGFFKDSRGLYRVEVKRKGKKYFVGRFKTVEEAKSKRADFLYSLLVK